MARVYVTGMGVISSIGLNLEEFWQRLVDGRSNITQQQVCLPDGGSQYLPYCRPDLDLLQPIANLVYDKYRTPGLATHYALCAARAALDQAKIFKHDTDSVERLKEAWLYVGTSTANLDLIQRALMKNANIKMLDAPQCLPATFVAMKEGIGGRKMTISTACCSSTDAIGLAFEAIRDENCELAIVVGVEGDFVDERLIAALQYGVQSKSGVCLPFDKRRDGGIFGEGAAALVLSRTPPKSGPVLECVGYTSLTHPTHPTHADTVAIARCMNKALSTKTLWKHSGKAVGRSREVWEETFVYLSDYILPHDVKVISPHAGGTVQGDEAMAEAMKDLFQYNAVGINYQPWCYNSRPLHGHSIGASGAMESVGLLLAMEKRQVPPSPIEAPAFDWIKDPKQVEPLPPECYGMKISVGMGGNYSCLIFKRTE